jgi:enoyl-CoA hydratase/carnithine racemase
MTTEPRVLVKVDGNIAFVTLNRADKHNGLDQQMMKQLVDTANGLKRNRAVRVVILQANGDSFCAGLDFSHVMKNPSIIPRYFIKLPWSKDNMFQRVANIWRDVPIPVISVIHGNCFGGGMQLVLGCDFRYAHSETQFSIMEMKWGLIPDMSGMVNLSRLTRLDIAQELTMTGRIFNANEAEQFGLVTRVSGSPLDDALELAHRIADQSPDAVAAAKFLFKKTWKKDARGALLWERLTQLRILGRKNNKIAIKNGMSKGDDKQSFIDRTSF